MTVFLFLYNPLVPSTMGAANVIIFIEDSLDTIGAILGLDLDMDFELDESYIHNLDHSRLRTFLRVPTQFATSFAFALKCAGMCNP